MRKRTRERVIEFLTRRPGATTGEIARGLGMAAPAVRHHLEILRRDGRLELATKILENRRGRPQIRYRVAGHLLGENLAMLADHLLSARGEYAEFESQQRMIEGLADRLASHLGTAKGTPGASAIDGVVNKMNALNYHARWEAGAAGPRLILGHCPYAAVIERHPELCEMDAAGLSKVLGAKAKQIAKISLRSDPTSRCVFSLGGTDTVRVHGGQ